MRRGLSSCSDSVFNLSFSLCVYQDLRALVLLLSVQPPQAIDPALCPALQELLGRCRVCVQQRSALELEAKDLKSKGTAHSVHHGSNWGQNSVSVISSVLVEYVLTVCAFLSAEDEGATPVKRRRVSSEDDRVGDAAAPLCVASTSSASVLPPCGESKPDHQEALTPTSTSDTETRDSSSLIDPGTEQDPPSPDPTPVSSGNLDSSPKEEKMEASSSSSSSFSSSSSSLLQEAGDGFGQGEEPELPQHGTAGEEQEEQTEQREGRRDDAVSTSLEEAKEEKEASSVPSSSSAATLSEDTAFPAAIGLVGEGPDGGGHTSSQVFPNAGPPPDMLDMLYRTVEATIAIVTKLSGKGPPSS